MRTDFVLSAEIIVIALGAVVESPLPTQVAVLVAIGVLMTAGVYGLVAAIVRLDDLGRYLAAKGGRVRSAIARMLLLGAPWLMRGLAAIGTAAMFLVGGGILTHAIPGAHDLIHDWLAAPAGQVAVAGPALARVLMLLADAAVGAAAGLVAFGATRVAGIR